MRGVSRRILFLAPVARSDEVEYEDKSSRMKEVR